MIPVYLEISFPYDVVPLGFFMSTVLQHVKKQIIFGFSFFSIYYSKSNVAGVLQISIWKLEALTCFESLLKSYTICL